MIERFLFHGIGVHGHRSAIIERNQFMTDVLAREADSTFSITENAVVRTQFALEEFGAFLFII
jgi:hypothetical protein